MYVGIEAARVSKMMVPVDRRVIQNAKGLGSWLKTRSLVLASTLDGSGRGQTELGSWYCFLSAS